jgi:hypothetical protein
MAFDMGYSIESVHSLMERFIMHHQLIRYNPETREIAIKNWGENNFDKAGKPMMMYFIRIKRCQRCFIDLICFGVDS